MVAFASCPPFVRKERKTGINKKVIRRARVYSNQENVLNLY
jgi:hypothetical protein